MMMTTKPRPRKNMPRVPLAEDAVSFPSGEAFGLRLPDVAAIIPRRTKPTPRTRKLRFNGHE